MLSGGLPAACWGPGPAARLLCLPQAPTGWKSPRIGWRQQRLFQCPALQLPHLGSRHFVSKLRDFVCLFYLIFLCRRHLYVVCVFPKHVPSALHRRYTFLEEMLQSHRVSGVFSLIGIGWYVKGVIQQFSFINRERKRFVFNVARSASCPKMKKIRAD